MSAPLTQQPQPDTPVEKEKSWFKRLLPVRSIDPGKESHSSLLSDKDVVYELQSKNPYYRLHSHSLIANPSVDQWMLPIFLKPYNGKLLVAVVILYSFHDLFRSGSDIVI